MKFKAIVAGTALTLAAGTAIAGEDFSILKGIQAEAMSHSEMDEVEGKSLFSFLWGYNYGNVLARGVSNPSYSSSYNWAASNLARGVSNAYYGGNNYRGSGLSYSQYWRQRSPLWSRYLGR